MKLEPDKRDEALDAACGDDDDLRREVGSLLAADLEAPTFLDGNAAELAAPSFVSPATSQAAEAGRMIGSYRLLRRIGVGGMGRVFLAERDDQSFTQRVAVKIMRGIAAETRDLRERFRAERQILANLGHPSIAKVFDGGVTDDGLPYLVMEYVAGEPIDRYCARTKAPLEQRLALFEDVCAAVQHAHRHLVVHRDLKPSNILVTDDSVVKLLDFGIAKLLEPGRVGVETTEPLTRTGLIVLTPEYAAPEQLRREEITTATDVYSLGVVLYELLAGVRPHDLAGSSATEIERAICEAEPIAPSARVDTMHLTPPGSGVEASHLRGDLDTIVLKALRKEPEARYESVRAFTEDLDRYRKGLPILARPSTWTYRARKFVRRNRYGVGAGALAILALLGGLTATTFQWSRAEREASKARQVTDFLVDLFKTNEPAESRGTELTARQILERGEDRIEQLGGEPDVQARLLSVMGRVYSQLGDFDRAEPFLYRALETATGDDERAQSLSELGALLYERGALDEAEHRQREALDIRLRARPRRDLDVAAALHELGKTLSEKRDPNARDVFAEALALRERFLGPHHPATAETLVEMGSSLTNLGQCDDAIPLFRRSLQIFDALENGELGVARAKAELAACFSDQGKVAEAEALIRDVLERYLAVFGEDHPNVMTQRNNLAVALARQGYYAEAEQLFRELLESRRRSMPDGAYTGNTLGNLGALMMFRERYADAEPILRETIDLMREKFGPDHLQTVRRINSLGHLKVATGELDQAEALFEESLDALRRTDRSEHPHFFVAQRGLGRLLGERQRYGEAVALLNNGSAECGHRAQPSPKRSRSWGASCSDRAIAIGPSMCCTNPSRSGSRLAVRSTQTQLERNVDLRKP